MLAMGLFVTTTMGCTTVQKWMAGGAAVGGTVGGIWASNGGILTAGEGIAVGAVTGATVGALVGDQQEQGGKWQEVEKANRDKDASIGKSQEAERAALTKLQACGEDLKTCKRKNDDLAGQVANLTDELAKCKGARMEITLLSDVLFEPGKARLSAEGRKALDDAAAKIGEAYGDKFVTVEGHTDSDPIKTSGWKDNWDLGAARSMAVLRHLIKKGVEPQKASAATFSEYQPASDNGSKEGKKKNRRSVIVVHTGWPRF